MHCDFVRGPVRGLKETFALVIDSALSHVEEWRQKGKEEGLPPSHCKLYTAAAELGKEGK